MLGSKLIDTINDMDIYDSYKYLYLSEKESKEELLQSIQLAPPRWNPSWSDERSYLTKRFQQVLQRRWSDTTTFEQNKQILSMLIPRI